MLDEEGKARKDPKYLLVAAGGLFWSLPLLVSQNAIPGCPQTSRPPGVRYSLGSPGGIAWLVQTSKWCWEMYRSFLMFLLENYVNATVLKKIKKWGWR